ncbi:MAG: ATP-binding protein [Acidilobaceae archaeon]
MSIGDSSSYGRLIGIVTSGSRASIVPIRVSRDALDFVRDEMLVFIRDFEENRLYLGIVKSSIKKDYALDASSLPTNFSPDSSHVYSAPLMHSYVEIIGEVTVNGVEISFSIPRPGSMVYAIVDGSNLTILRVHDGLNIGSHKFSNVSIAMDPRSLSYHVAVLGATGTGKSRLVKAIVEEVLTKTNYKIIIFDHTGLDYSDISRWSNINVELVDASKIVLDPDVIAETISSHSGLKQYEEEYVYYTIIRYLSEGIEANPKPQVKIKTDIDIENIVEKYREYCKSGKFKWSFKKFIDTLYNAMKELNARDTTIRKLELLISLRVGRKFFENYLNIRNTVVSDIIRNVLTGKSRLVIVDLSREVEYTAKRFIIYQILKNIWDWIVEVRSRVDTIAVIDEAHNYACHGCGESESMISRVVREGRKWGFGVIIASQRIIDLDPNIRGNINTVFFSRMQSSSDYEELKKWLEGVQFMEYTLPMLAPREFFFTGLGNPLRKPILVRVRDVL